MSDDKTGIDLYKTNQVHVSKKRDSADAVAICMLLLKQDMPANAVWKTARSSYRFESCFSHRGNSSMVEYYTFNVEKKYTASLKMVTNI